MILTTSNLPDVSAVLPSVSAIRDITLDADDLLEVSLHGAPGVEYSPGKWFSQTGWASARTPISGLANPLAPTISPLISALIISAVTQAVSSAMIPNVSAASGGVYDADGYYLKIATPNGMRFIPLYNKTS